jgi:hypothetical protein
MMRWEVAMAVRRFQIGDHVQARTSGFVTAGTHGTVQQVLRSRPTMYYVQFDGYGQLKLMHARDLERADDVPPGDAK